MKKLACIAYLLLLSVAATGQDTLSEPVVDTTTVEIDTESEQFEARIAVDTSHFQALNPEKAAPLRFDPDFRSRYQSSAFSYKDVTPQKSLWQRFVAWLDRKLKEWFDLRDTETSGNVLTIIGYTLLGIIALVALYFLARALFHREGNWVFSRSPQAGLRYDEGTGNIESADFDDLIRRALAQNDRRLATRYQYLRLLRELSRRGFIEFDKEKTNSEYAYEIREEALRRQFQYLSYLYNYIWYGKFEVDEPTYAKTAVAFQETITKLA